MKAILPRVVNSNLKAGAISAHKAEWLECSLAGDIPSLALLQ